MGKGTKKASGSQSQSRQQKPTDPMTEVKKVTEKNEDAVEPKIIKASKVRLPKFAADLIRTKDSGIVWQPNKRVQGQGDPLPTIEHENLKFEPIKTNLPSANLILPSGKGRKTSAQDLFAQIHAEMHEVFLPPDPTRALLMVLYALASWNFDLYQVICYLAFIGLPGSAKSLALRVMAQFSYNSFVTSGSSTMPAILRTIDGIGGTLLMDECQQRGADPTSDFHRMLAEGNQSDGIILQCVPQNGSDYIYKSYSVYCPKILGGRSLPADEAIQRRTIEVRLPFREPSEVKIIPLTDRTWLIRAAELRNSLLLYRQARAMRLMEAPGKKFLPALEDSKLSLSERQVFAWLVQECPTQEVPGGIAQGHLTAKDSSGGYEVAQLRTSGSTCGLQSVR